MADNVTGKDAAGATYTVASDDIGGSHYQRVKVGHGVDGAYVDTSATNPLPMARLDTVTTGTITATDAVLGSHAGAGVPLEGTPTTGSYVAHKLNGESGFSLRLSGTFGGGTVWLESSVDSTNGIDGAWTTNLMRQSGVDQTFVDATILGPGIYRGVAAGYSYLRVRVTGATTPSIGVVYRASAGPSVTALVASIPPGSNNIGWVQVGTKRTETFRGRAGTFRQLGIAGTAGQNLFSMFNAAGSTVLVSLESISFDVFQTAARVVAPPVIRLHRITTLPTGGTALPKVAEDTAQTSNASVTLLQGTASEAGAATAIVSTPAAGTILTQEPVARALTLVGYEQFDRGDFLSAGPIVLRAGEGVLFRLDYSVATSNPITDNYTVNVRWIEYTP